MIKKRTFKIILGLAVLLFGWVFFSSLMAQNLIIEKDIEKPEAMLILGGSTVYLERTRKAAELYKIGKTSKVFLIDDGGKAGWSEQEKRNPPFVELAKKELLKNGVPEFAIEILPHFGDGTNYEAQVFVKKAKELQLKKILLVTSAYHTSRALWTFEKFFKENDLQVEIGVFSPPAGQQTPSTFTWWLSAKGWNVVAGEYMKFVYYWFFL